MRGPPRLVPDYEDSPIVHILLLYREYVMPQYIIGKALEIAIEGGDH